MNKKQFEELYRNKEFYNKYKSVCNEFFLSNRDKLANLAIYDKEDLEQEALLEVFQSKSNCGVNYYIRAIQNQLIDFVRRAGAINA